jgi:hypothetical protein
MAKFSVDAKYLSHSDISEHEDTILTIKTYEQETMGQGKDAVDKWVLYFREIKKGLGLNKTNGKMCCKLFNSDDMDTWLGKKIALYVKDDVEYQGEIMSAIRVRAKLPGAPAPETEDFSSLTFEEVVYRLDHAEGLKEIGALMTHAINTMNCTAEQIKILKDAKESRVNALVGA